MPRNLLIHASVFLIAFTGMAPAALAGGFKGGTSDAKQPASSSKAAQASKSAAADRAAAADLGKLIRSGLISRYQAMRVGGQVAEINKLLQIAEDAKAVGLTKDRVVHYQDLYANDPGARTSREILRQMTVEGLGLPKEALDTDLTGPEMVDLQGAASALTGDIGAIFDPATWRRVSKEGVEGAHMGFLKAGIGAGLPPLAFELGDVPSLLEGMGVGNSLGVMDDAGFWGDFISYKSGNMSQGDVVRRNVPAAVWAVMKAGYGGDAKGGNPDGTGAGGRPREDEHAGVPGVGSGSGGFSGSGDGTGSGGSKGFTGGTGDGTGNGSGGSGAGDGGEAGGAGDGDANAMGDEAEGKKGGDAEESGPSGPGGSGNGEGQEATTPSGSSLTMEGVVVESSEESLRKGETWHIEGPYEPSDSDEVDSTADDADSDIDGADDTPPDDVDEYTPNPEQPDGPYGPSLSMWLELLEAVDNAEEFVLGFRQGGDVDPSEDDLDTDAADGEPRDPDGLRGRYGEGMGPLGTPSMEELLELAEAFRRGDRPDDGVTDPSDEG